MSEQTFFCICGALLGFIAGAAAVAAYYTIKESRDYYRGLVDGYEIRKNSEGKDAD